MFGHHAARRQKRKQKQEQTAFANEKLDWENNAPAREKEAADFKQKQVSDKVAQSKADRQAAREEGRADTEAFFRKDNSGLGLDPKQREAMQFEANKAIQRGHQSANRKLLGEQSQNGIVGKGGVGYAQQRDLMRMSNEAQAGVDRDLTKLDKDLELKKLAAIFTGGEGNAAQSLLDKQLAQDELELFEEKKKAKKYEDQRNLAFNRI
jgi:hypothetical protein